MSSCHSSRCRCIFPHECLFNLKACKCMFKMHFKKVLCKACIFSFTILLSILNILLRFYEFMLQALIVSKFCYLTADAQPQFINISLTVAQRQDANRGGRKLYFYGQWFEGPACNATPSIFTEKLGKVMWNYQK